VSKCTDVRFSEEELKSQEFYDSQKMVQDFETEFGDQASWLTKAFEKISKLGFSKKPISEKQIKAKFDSLYKEGVKNGLNEKRVLATNIIVATMNNPHLAKHFNKYMAEEIVSRGIKANFVNTSQGTAPEITSLPLDALRVFNFQINRWVNNGKMFKQSRGIFGNLYYEWGSTRQNMKLDNSGLFAEVNEITEQFPARSATWTNYYLDNQRRPVAIGSKKYTKYGIKSIINDLNLWSKIHEIPEDTSWRLFSGFMGGRIIVDKRTGSIQERTQWAPYVLSNGEKAFRWSNDDMIDFKYVDYNGQEKTLERLSNKFVGETQPRQLTEFLRIADQTAAILDEIGKNAIKEIDSTQSERARIAKKLKANKLSDFISERIEDIYDGDIQIAGLNKAALKEGKYYPTMYRQAEILPMFENAVTKQEIALQNKLATLTNPAKELTGEQKVKLNKEISDHQFSISVLNDKINILMDPDTAFDNTGNPIRTSVWYKNFKTVSNVMDKRQERTGSDVLIDYVTQFGNQVERNNAVLRTVEAVADAKIRGANDNQINAAVDTFNTTFYNQDAYSQMFGIDMTAEKWSSRLNNMGIPSSPGGIRNYAKAYSSWTTSSLLYGPIQGIVNLSAAFLKADISGASSIASANLELMKRPNFWKKETENAGIATFSDFVNTYFSVTLRPEEIQAYNKEIQRLTDIIKNPNYKSSEVIKLRKKYRRTIKFRQVRNKLDAAAQYIVARKKYFEGQKGFINKFLQQISPVMDSIPDIASTEDMLRTRSYIIGATRAVEYGYAKNIASPEAKQMGVAYTMLTDFGLSQNNVGAALRGPIAGATLNKMKIWHNQKSGFDFRIWRDAAIARTNTLDSMYKLRLAGNVALMPAKSLIDGATSMFTRIIGDKRAGMGVTRRAAPFQASYNSSTLRQGLVTALFDVFIYGPGGRWVAKPIAKLAYGGGSGSMVLKGVSGMSSTMLSGLYAAGALTYSMIQGEDETDWDEKLMKFYRYTPFGVGLSQILSGALWAAQAADLASKEDRAFKNHAEQFIRPIAGPFSDIAVWMQQVLQDQIEQRTAD